MRFAYLFGSHGRGEAGPRSDVDVAVHAGGHGDQLLLVLDLQRRLYRAVGVECDVVLLEAASLRLLHRILQDAVLIYDVAPVERVRFESTARVRAGDFAIHADRLDRELLRATAEGRR